MSHSHLHTGMCNYTDYFEQNSQSLKIVLPMHIFGWNKRLVKLSMSSKDQRTRAESVKQNKQNKLKILPFSYPDPESRKIEDKES